MEFSNIPEPIRQTFYTYFNVNDSLGVVALREVIESVRGKTLEEQGWTVPFRRQLAEAISSPSISVDQFEALTGRDFDSESELVDYLREVWAMLYDESPIGAQ